MMNERPDGAGEQAHSALSDEMALQSPCLTGSFEGIASAKPPLVKEITVRSPKCKSPEAQEALEPTKDAKKAEERRVDQEPRQEWNDPLNTKGDGQAGKTIHLAQVEPTAAISGPEVLSGLLQSNSSNEVRCDIPLGDVDEDQRVAKTVGCATALTNQAEQMEAASAQAVNRGHKVEMSEVPDQDDDTSFMMNMKANLTPTIEIMVTLPTVVEPSQVDAKAEKVPHEWLKPFGPEWTLCSIVQAKTESEAKAILKHWIHKARAEEVVDNMIEGMRKASRTNALEWLEELQQPRRYIATLSGKGKDLLIDIQVETLENRTTFGTQALIDSGCTSSAINQSFVEKHNIPTHATAAPITVYNADGTKNSGGAIIRYAKICLTIGNHTERIDLAVMELGNRQIFLGHDWLNWHNPIINWKTGGLTFARCQCHKTPFMLPDADPDNKWDEELEEGETILAIDFTQAILIRAHHANDLATKASEEKKAKTFEEMVPEWCRDFADLFEKDNFDELPEPKTWDHAIELTPNANANLDCKVYPLNHSEQAELNKFLDENLSSGRIRPSKSPMASPFFFVKKKDGKLRPVQDYRKLNKMTIKNCYLLPLISELMDKLQGAKYFSKLDIRWGYNNVCIKSGDKWKAAFRTN